MMLTLLLAAAVQKPLPPDPDLSCRNLVEIKFDRPGIYKKKVKDEVDEYNYEWAQLGDYQVWSGEDVPQRIVDSKEKTACELDYQNIRTIKKFKDYDLLFIDAYRGKTEYTSVIRMKDCKKLWELEIKTEVSELTFNSSMTVIKNVIKGSDLDKCQHCWNDKTEACRNLPVSRRGDE